MSEVTYRRKPDAAQARTPMVFVGSRDHNGWGNCIHLFIKKDEDGKVWCVSGHKTPLPQDGDVFLHFGEKNMAGYRLTEVRPCRDPRDMFFATGTFEPGLATSICDRWAMGNEFDMDWLPETFSFGITDEEIQSEISTWRPKAVQK